MKCIKLEFWIIHYIICFKYILYLHTHTNFTSDVHKSLKSTAVKHTQERVNRTSCGVYGSVLPVRVLIAVARAGGFGAAYARAPHCLVVESSDVGTGTRNGRARHSPAFVRAL